MVSEGNAGSSGGGLLGVIYGKIGGHAVSQKLPKKSLTLPRAARRLNPSLPMPSSGRPLSYLEAGVDIDAGERLVENIKPYAKRTLRPEVLAGIGGFGALIELPKRFREPVLVAGTDGVGTKLKLAFAL